MLRGILQIGRISTLQPLIKAETCLAQQTRVCIQFIISSNLFAMT